MKSKILHLFVAVSISTAASISFAHAQTNFGPEFTPGTTVVDFGEVDATKDSGYRTFTFSNSGSTPLLITATEGSCGCTTPEKPTAPIKPGDKGEIKIKYDITRKGTFSKTVTITTNEEDGKNTDGTIRYKQHVIQVKGNVKG